MESSGLLDLTPGTALPLSDTIGEIAAFALRQTGQLDKANADKGGARRILNTCTEWQERARAEAQRRNKPWWRRIF